MATTKQFLDYAGLSQFWSLIKGKFVNKIDFKFRDGQGYFDLIDVDGKLIGDEDQPFSISIPYAASSHAGFMSATQAAKLDNALTGVKIAGITATVANDSVDLDLVYNKEQKQIQIVDSNSEAVLTYIDATDFVKDGMLTSAELVVDPVIDPSLNEKMEGTFIKLVWNTESDKTEPMYIDVTSLIDTYTAGNGLTLTDHEFAVKVSGGYLTSDANGVSLNSNVWDKVETITKEYVDPKIEEINTVLGAPANGDDAATGVYAYVDTTVNTGVNGAKSYTDTKIGTPYDVATDTAATGLYAYIDNTNNTLGIELEEKIDEAIKGLDKYEAIPVDTITALVNATDK